MGLNILRIVLLLSVLNSIIYANPAYEDRSSINFTHSNDFNYRGYNSGLNTGDDLLTGTLGIYYRSDDAFYEMDLKSYTQKYIEEGERVDILSLGYLRDVLSKSSTEYSYRVTVGAQFIQSGNFGGDMLQEAIHSVTASPLNDLPYATETQTTFGVQGRMSGLYILSQDFNLYNNLDFQVNLDHSGRGKCELGIEGTYESISFWVAGVLQYIEPLDHSVVEFSTPDKYSNHVVLGGSVRLLNTYEFMMETTFGGAPLGENDDYSTHFRLRYFLD